MHLCELLQFLSWMQHSPQTAPDSVDLYAQQVGRSGRDGDVAVCLLFFSSQDLEPVRRAAARAAISLNDACVTSSVVAEKLDTSGIAFVPGAAFVSHGVAAARIPTALGLLASAALFAVGTQTHEHGNVLRGPAWSCPPASLSADAAHVLYTALFPSYAASGSFFASCSMATLAGRQHFSHYGVGATKAVVRALEELDACGVVLVSKWRGSLFPVASLRDLKPSREEVELAWAPASLRQQQSARALTKAVSFFSESSCISMRLCELFGEENEMDRILQACKCCVCQSELPLF